MNLIDLQEKLRELNIQKGDILYVASDITKVLVEAGRGKSLKNKEDRDVFLRHLTDSFQSAVGAEGTLLFPVFTWDFCRKKPFSRKNTPGEVGAYNNWILKELKDFVRTRHPLYSFMVWGKYADELTRLQNEEAFGVDSPFAWLHKNKGKMLLVSVSLQRAFTFMHYVEASLRVPYRYLKNFRSEYEDYDGTVEMRNYTMYVRDLDIISHEYMPDEFLEKPQVMRSVFWQNIPLKVIDLDKSYKIFADDLKNNGGKNCYKFENYQIDWLKGATHKDDLNN
ncbi:MAG: AAC(3) family N-acetyltransferase [Selenomonadaceae bacterium]|nr:AAC(3) family N-acetyltransferase [Selenomonadaceae bacterium]